MRCLVLVSLCTALYILTIVMIASSLADLPPPTTHRLSRVPVATYDVGDTARLTCQLGASFPRPRLTWQLRDPATDEVRALPDRSRTEDALTVLVLPRLRVRDSGLYSCTATNILGSIVASVRVIVKERAEQPRRIIRLTAFAAAGLNATLHCQPPSGTSEQGAAPPAMAVWSREGGPLPKGRHFTLSNSSLMLSRLRSSDTGAYFCEAALHNGQRVTLLYDLQVQRLIPSFRNPPPARHAQQQLQPPQPPAYVRLHHISLPYLQHKITVAFRARRGLGLILYSGTGVKGSDFLSLSLVDWHLVYQFNLGSGSALLRSRQPIEPEAWTVARLDRAGRAGSLTVAGADGSGESQPVEQSAPGDRQGLGLPPTFHLGCAPAELLTRLTVQLGAAAAACLDGDISQLSVSGRRILIGDNAAADVAGVGGDVRQADVCGAGNATGSDAAGNGTGTIGTGSEACLNDGVCLPDHSLTGHRCLCPGDFTGRWCERRRERCAPTACGRHGRCHELTDGIRCDCGLGLSGERCEIGQPIRVPHFPGNGSASSASYLAVSASPQPSGSLLSLSVRPDHVDSGLLMFTGDLVGRGGDFQSLELRNGRVRARVRIAGRLHQLSSDQPLPLASWTRLHFRRSLTELSLRLNQSHSVKLSLPANGSRPHIAGHLYLAGLSHDVIAAADDVTAGQGGFRGCLKDLELMASRVELAEAAVEHDGVGDCADALGCRSGLCESATCRDRVDSRPRIACDCPDGRSGQFCEHRETPCDRTVCLNAGRCRGLGRDRHECLCRLGFSGPHCQIAAPLHQAARFHGNGFIELRGSYLSGSNWLQFQIEFWLRIDNGSSSTPSLVLWHGQPADELPDGQDFVAVSISARGRLRVDCAFAEGSDRRLAELESGLDSPRLDDGVAHRFRLLARRHDQSDNSAVRQLQVFVDDSLTASATLPLSASSLRRGSVFVGGLPDSVALTAASARSSLSRLLGGLRGCLWGLRMQNWAPVNFMAESLSGFGATQC